MCSSLFLTALRPGVKGGVVYHLQLVVGCQVDLKKLQNMVGAAALCTDSLPMATGCLQNIIFQGLLRKQPSLGEQPLLSRGGYMLLKISEQPDGRQQFHS